MTSDLKTHLTAKSTWMRLLYMILFVVAFNVGELVAGVVVIVQFLFKLFTGQVNAQLLGFGHALAIYFRQTVAFLTYDSEDMPFPFAPWPDGAAAPARPAAQTAPEPPAPEPPAPEPVPEPPAAEAAPEPPTAAKPAARPKPKTKSTRPKRARKKPQTDDELPR
jgi:type IV secretory pathway VirB10-like protein